MSDGDIAGATPLAIRLAAAAGLSLSGVTGSGLQGRILKRDVASLLGHSEGERFGLAAAAAELEPGRVPLGAADFPASVEFEIDTLVDLRDRLNRASPETEQLRLSHLFVKAAAVAMRLTREANAAFGLGSAGGGIALVMTLETGVVAPVIRSADHKALRRIACEARELAHKARTRQSGPDECQGTALSMVSFELAADQVFPPTMAAPGGYWLLIGPPQMRPVVRGGVVVAATVSSASLARRDRAMDAPDARWLHMFKAILEEPLALLL